MRRTPHCCFSVPVASVRGARSRVSVDLNALVREARANGYGRVAGVDEAGAGALAGPLVVSSICLRPTHSELVVPYLGDSKTLTPTRRAKIYDALHQHDGISIATHVVSAREVDEMNILRARKHGLAVVAGQTPADFLFVDGNFILDGLEMPQKAVVHGDALVSVVAAASVVAKVVRDRIMTDELAGRFPLYRFEQHKGYATKLHKQLLSEHGPCEEHRTSYRPVRESMENYHK